VRKATAVGVFSRVQAYNEGLTVYLYDDSLLESWKQCGDIDRLLWDCESGSEFVAAFQEGDLIAYELPQDDDIYVDIALRPPLTDEEIACMNVREPLTGFLRLPTGRLCVECANDFRFDPDIDEAEEEGGILIEVPRGDYRVRIYHVDMDALALDEQVEYRGPFQVVTLEPTGELGKLHSEHRYLRFPLRKEAFPVRKLDTSWAGRYTFDGGIFTGVFVHNYDVSGPCINFDREAETALGLEIGDRLVIEFDSAGIEALFLGNADALGPEVDEFARVRNHTKCRFVTDREGIEKLMLFEFPDRDMMHFDFRKTRLFGTRVKIRRLG